MLRTFTIEQRLKKTTVLLYIDIPTKQTVLTTIHDGLIVYSGKGCVDVAFTDAATPELADAWFTEPVEWRGCTLQRLTVLHNVARELYHDKVRDCIIAEQVAAREARIDTALAARGVA